MVAAVTALYRENDSLPLGITLGHSLLKASIALDEEDEREKGGK